MNTGASRVAQTVAGDVIVYVVCPLLVALAIGAVALMFALNRRLNTQDRALAILVHEVSPEGQPSLKTIVQAIDSRVARIEGANPPGRR